MTTTLERAACTCCEPSRPIHREPATPGDNTEWCHDDDEMFATVYHVHSYGGGRDCDGPTDYADTYRLTSLNWDRIFAADPGRTPDDAALWRALVSMEIPACAEEATIQIVTGQLNWHEVTDEGSRGGTLIACTDPSCAFERSSQRDYYAEAAGY